jgi:Na+-transporting methylmalonyl-CoA/oxaloacetate decarboxylase gamma subunit
VAATNLLLVCAVAFTVVFTVLALLAAAMHVITIVFPARAPAPDSAVVAAISSTVAVLVPGARVTRVEEES